MPNKFTWAVADRLASKKQESYLELEKSAFSKAINCSCHQKQTQLLFFFTFQGKQIYFLLQPVLIA